MPHLKFLKINPVRKARQRLFNLVNNGFLKGRIKIFYTITVISLIAVWIFLGWPQIWQQPPFPPAVKTVKAASTCTSAATGNWNAQLTWSGCGVDGPVAGDTVIIASGHVVTIPSGVAAEAATVTLNAAAVANGVTLTDSTSSLTLTGAITMNAVTAAVDSTFAVGAGTLTAASISISGSATADRDTILSLSTGTINVSGNVTCATANWQQQEITFTGAGTINVSGNFAAGSTYCLFTRSTGLVKMNGGAAQVLGDYTYYSVEIANTSGGVTLEGTSYSITYRLTITTGTLTVGGYNLDVADNTLVKNTGTLTFSSTTGQKTFGNITVNSGGAMIFTAAESLERIYNLTNNGTISGTTGTLTFANDSTIDSTSDLNVANATFGSGTNSVSSGTTLNVSGTLTLSTSSTYLTNNGTLTISTAYTVTGGYITNAATGTLNIGGTSTAGCKLVASASGNTVNFTGAAQTVQNCEFYNLGLSGSGAKTLQTSTSTISGNLTLSGTASTTTVDDLAITGNLDVGAGSQMTLAGHTVPITGTTSVTGTLVISSATGTKTFTGDTTIYEGGTWNNSGNEAITFGGSIDNDGTFTSGTASYTLSGTSEVASGTISFDALNVTGTYTNNNNQAKTLTVTTTLSSTNYTGVLTQGASATLAIGAATVALNLTATADGNLVNYNLGGAQTVASVTYHDLTLSTSGAKTLTNLTTIQGDFTTSGSITASTAAAMTVSGNLAVNDTSQLTVAGFNFSVTGTTKVYGTLINSSTTGTKTFTDDTTIYEGGTWNNSGDEDVTFGGSIDNDGTFTSGAGTYTLSGSSEVASGTISFAAVDLTGTYTNNDNQAKTLTITTTLSSTGGTGTLTQGINSTFNIGAATITPALTATASGNTVNYNSTSQGQTVKATTYVTLTFNNTGQTATLAAGTTAATTLTITSGTLNTDNRSLSVSGTTSITGTLGVTTGTAGTPSFADLTINNGGTFQNTANDDVAVSGSLSNGGTLTAGTGAYDFTGTDKTIGGANAVSFSSLTISGTIANDGTLTVTDTLAGSGTLTNNADKTLNIGAASVTPTLTATASGNTVNYNSTSQGQTVKATTYVNLTITKSDQTAILGGDTIVNGTLLISAGTLDLNTKTLTLGVDFSTTSGTLAIGTGTLTGSTGDYDLTVGTGATVTQGTGTLSIQDLTISGTGAYTCSGNSVINVDGNLAISSANWTPSTSTLTMTAGDGNVTINSSKTLYNLILNSSNNFDLNTNGLTLNNSATLTKQGSGDLDTNALALSLGNLTLSAGTINTDARAGTWDLAGNVDIAAGTLKATSGAFTVGGNWTTTGTFTHNSGTVTFDSSAAQTITGATTWNNLTIDNSASPDDSNDVDPGAKQTVIGTLTVTDGQWTPYTGDDYATVVIDTNGILKPDASASITVSGNWTTTGTFTHNSSTVTFDSSSAQTITGATTWNNLTISNTHALPSDDNDVDPSAKQTIVGTLTVSDGQYTPYTGDDYANVTIETNGILKPDSGASITISGNWSNSGAFTHNSGGVTLDGTSQSLTGSNTFYTLVKSVTSADTLTFDNTVTQDITNSLTLNGVAGQLLSLRSDSTGNQFGITLNSTQSLSYLDVKDSDASGGTALAAGSTSTDSGNNTNWTFGTTTEEETPQETPRSGGSAAGRPLLFPRPGPKPIIIGDGSTYTNSRYTVIYFDSLDTTEMNLNFGPSSEELNDFKDDNWTNFVFQKDWNLGEKDGSFKGSVKFRSADGFVSNPYSAFITLDATAPQAPTIKTPKANQQFNTNNPTFFGETEPNSKVSLKIGQRVYRFEAPAGGMWSLDITPALPVGSYTLEARAEDWAGNTSRIITVPFSIVKALEKPLPPTPPQPPAKPGEEITPSEKEKEEIKEEEKYIPVSPEEIPPESWYQEPEPPQTSPTTLEKIIAKLSALSGAMQRLREVIQKNVQNTAKGLALGGKTAGQGIMTGVKKTTKGLMGVTQTTDKFVQQEMKKVTANTRVKSRQIIFPLTSALKKNLTFQKLAQINNTITSPFRSFFQRIRLALNNALQKIRQGIILAFQKAVHNLALAGKATARAIAFAAKKTNDGLIIATQITGKLAQQKRVSLFSKIKNIIPKKAVPLPSEFAQQATPEEIPTLIPKNMPQDVVIVKSRKGNFDLARAGEINLIAGMKVYSFIRPSVQAKRVVGRLLFNQTLSQTNTKETNNHETNKTADVWQVVKPAQAAEAQAATPAQAMEWQVAEVEYKDLKENNIYMAELDIPQIAGEYTFQTEVEITEGSKLYNLKTKVERRGYVFKKSEEGETRLSKVKVTLYYLNPKTNQKEIWAALSYDQVNPQITKEDGEYFFLVPIGEYYLTAQKSGYEDYQNDITMRQAGPITYKIDMLIKKINWFKKIFN